MAIIDVINYEGPNNVLVWKHDAEDFSTLSQLIVHESQEALFFKDGEALDLLGPGRHTLHTQNIPILGKLINLPFGGETPFHCEIYYINKTEEMAIRWGTDRRVAFVDNSLEPPLPLSIGAAGEMTIRVKDSRKLVVKLVGTEAALGQDRFMSYMRSIINMAVKPVLARVMQSGEFSIFDIDAHMDELAAVLHKQLIPEFDDYGIELRRFMILNIAKPEDDPMYQRYYRAISDQSLNVLEAQARQNEQVKEAETRWKVAEQDAQKTIIDAQAAGQAKVIDANAEAEKRRVEGYTYQQERSFDVSQTVAANDAVGEFTNMGIGMGMISGIGGSLSGTVAGMANDALAGGLAGSGATGSGPDASMFAVQDMPAATGEQTATSQPVTADPLEDLRVRIDKLKLLHDSGLMNDDEFEAQRQRLISEV